MFGGTRRYHKDYRTCTGIAELILILKYYGTYADLTEHILVLRNLYCNSDTEVPVGTTEYFTGTRVPVGTTELNQTQEYP